VRVSGQRGDESWSQQIDLAKAARGSGLDVAWARAKIESLVDGLRAGGNESYVRAEVVKVALAHHVVSRYTSLVAVDRQPVRPPDAPLVATTLPNALPSGMVVAD